MADRIDIALGFDDGFAPHASATIASVVATAPKTDFRFIILHAGVSPERQAMVERSAPHAEFFWRELEDEELPDFRDRGHFTKAIMFRLGIEAFAPADCRRIIYLDADMIVMRNLRELWELDLEGYPIGAVHDTYSTGEAFAQLWKLESDNPVYFNSGMMLIDLEKVRKEKSFSAAIDFFERNDEKLFFADQDALNFVFWDRWKQLDTCWNIQRDMVIPGIAANLPPEKKWKANFPGVIHYTGLDKPWLPSGWHPWSWAYWAALGRTPFAREIGQRYKVSTSHKMRLFIRWLKNHPRGARVM